MIGNIDRPAYAQPHNTDLYTWTMLSVVNDNSITNFDKKWLIEISK